MPGEYIKAFTEKENREDELISIGFERPEK